MSDRNSCTECGIVRASHALEELAVHGGFEIKRKRRKKERKKDRQTDRQTDSLSAGILSPEMYACFWRFLFLFTNGNGDMVVSVEFSLLISEDSCLSGAVVVAAVFDGG